MPSNEAAAERLSLEAYPLPGLVIVTVVTALLIVATGIENPVPPKPGTAVRESPTAYPPPPVPSVTAVTAPPETVMFAVAPLPVPVTSANGQPV
jgi:hypothetical protein